MLRKSMTKSYRINFNAALDLRLYSNVFAPCLLQDGLLKRPEIYATHCKSPSTVHPGNLDIGQPDTRLQVRLPDLGAQARIHYTHIHNT